MNIYKVGFILTPPAELSEFCASVRAAGMLTYSRRGITLNPHDPLDLSPGEFVVTLGARSTDGLIASLVRWFRAAPGRAVRVKVGGDLKAASSADEIEEYLKAGIEIFHYSHPNPATYNSTDMLLSAAAELRLAREQSLSGQ